MNQIIWNNKYILSEGKSIFQPIYYKQGILKVGNLVSNEGIFSKVTKFSVPLYLLVTSLP